MDSFGSSGNKRSSVVLVFYGREENSGLNVAKIPLFFKIIVRENIESQ